MRHTGSSLPFSGSRVCGLSSCGIGLAAPRLVRSQFLDQGSNPGPLHWKADSQPLDHQGNPRELVFLPWVSGPCWVWSSQHGCAPHFPLCVLGTVIPLSSPLLFAPFLIHEMGLARMSTSKRSPQDRFMKAEHRASNAARTGHTVLTAVDAGSFTGLSERERVSGFCFSPPAGALSHISLAIRASSGEHSSSCLPALLNIQ